MALANSAAALGIGRAMGTCVDAAGHSEGSPKVTVVGSAIAQNLTSQNQLNSQLNVGTAGVSIIDGLNDGLPGTNITLGIATSLGGVVGSHSSLVPMNTAEEALFRGDQSQRISPVDIVTVGNDMTGGAESTNFPNSQGAGRGSVNPDAVTPATTVFNQATALPNAPAIEGSNPTHQSSDFEDALIDTSPTQEPSTKSPLQTTLGHNVKPASQTFTRMGDRQAAGHCNNPAHYIHPFTLGRTAANECSFTACA